jgi:hypothetical protein
MSDFTNLYAGLTAEQQLYLQQQNARLMMIRSMNQSSSGQSLAPHSSQSVRQTSFDPLPNLQHVTGPVDAGLPKSMPTGYYLLRQADLPTSHASTVHDVPVDHCVVQPESQSQIRSLHSSAMKSVQISSEEVQKQMDIQQQIQQLQVQYQIKVQAQQQQQQQQQQSQPSIPQQQQ